MLGSSKKETTRDRLLDAAEAVVARERVARLTLDAVAAEAGMSKGGVLYHFGTKDALLGAMVRRLYETFEEGMESRVDSMPEAPGRFARAFVDATLESSPPRPEGALGVSAGLLTAIAHAPGLLDPLRERYASWQESVVGDGVDPAVATLVRLAADGLWFAELLGLAPPEGELRARVRQALVSLTEGKDAASEGRAANEGTGAQTV